MSPVVVWANTPSIAPVTVFSAPAAMRSPVAPMLIVPRVSVAKMP